MKCEKCGGEWVPPKTISVSLTNCPFCNAPLLNAEVANSYTEMGDFLCYLVSLYGADLYGNRQKLNDLISDLYRGDDRMKRAYRRAILDESLPQRIHALSLKPKNEREAFRNQIIVQFSEANFYSLEFGKQIVDSFVKGLGVEIEMPISTEATEEDGKWVDEYGVTYSADRRKLIEGDWNLETYSVNEGTVVICDEAFRSCENLTHITLPNSVTHIGDRAFESCVDLTCITLPNSVTHIGDSAFESCNNLTCITLPCSVIHIGDWVFYCCENLASIILPNSLTHIGDWAFDGCRDLTTINIPQGTTNKFKSLLYKEYHPLLKETSSEKVF
ncbi:leucine-rich repeat domain-containing protein [uncultured Parabacteroides sp.]|uniref:leucine-rich repeat domain-containing protein n=1 Tax=uncultured Parabacteroides sp. TaxID=512312 RepID=UPI00259B4613|nr:leucine-rich repeat domain-containing protein [uncultured Parabacteroides sp.]